MPHNQHSSMATILAKKTMDQKDVDRFIITDSPTEIATLISKVAKESFG